MTSGSCTVGVGASFPRAVDNTDHSPTYFRNPKKSSRQNAAFLKEIFWKRMDFRSNIFSTPKQFCNFSHRRKIIYFRDFFYDLEISESSKNVIHNAVIRPQKFRLKKVVFFLEDFFGYAKTPKVGWWMIWILDEDRTDVRWRNCWNKLGDNV